MKNKQVIDDKEVLKAFKKSVKEQTRKKLAVTYLDKDGSIKKIKTKITKGDDKR